MLPFSEDWYLTWGPNIHTSMFANVYAFLEANSKPDRRRCGRRAGLPLLLSVGAEAKRKDDAVELVASGEKHP
jgi:hypothetical protein